MSNSPVTFRDFAGALMADDLPLASSHLEALLGVSVETARAGAEYFRAQISSDPSFMAKAMAMRQVVQTGTREELVTLLEDCFSLGSDSASAAAGVVWDRFRSESGAS